VSSLFGIFFRETDEHIRAKSIAEFLLRAARFLLEICAAQDVGASTEVFFYASRATTRSPFCGKI